MMDRGFIKNSKGFTLIELMIVVAIIGILAAIAIPQFKAYRNRAYIASMEADCNAVKLAEETYYTDKDSYYLPGSSDTSATIVTALNEYGVKYLSEGNSVAIKADPTNTGEIIITITSSKVAGKETTYKSVDGKMETAAPQQ